MRLWRAALQGGPEARTTATSGTTAGDMREVSGERIASAVRDLFLRANYDLPEEAVQALRGALERERQSTARSVLETLLRNAEIARRDRMAMCQDCGLAVVFAELGRDCYLDGDLYAAVDEGVRQAYAAGYLRKSALADPLQRNSNTGDNTPAIVHVRLARVVFGASDPKAGSAGSALNLLQFPSLNHRCDITGGVREPECRAMLRDFFALQRARGEDQDEERLR